MGSPWEQRAFWEQRRPGSQRGDGRPAPAVSVLEVRGPTSPPYCWGEEAPQPKPGSLWGQRGSRGFSLAPKHLARETHAKRCDYRGQFPPVATILEEGLMMVTFQQNFQMQLTVAMAAGGNKQLVPFTLDSGTAARGPRALTNRLLFSSQGISEKIGNFHWRFSFLLFAFYL